MSQNAFIRDNLAKFGLSGSNNEVPVEGKRQPWPPPTFELTKGNHYRWGYDAGEYNVRPTSAATYWVEYGRSSRPHGSIADELGRALGEMREHHGKLSISNTRTTRSQAVLAQARASKIDIEQISLQLGDFKPPKPSDMAPNRHIQKTWDEFVEFAHQFSAAVGNPSSWIALEAYHGHLSERVHVYSHTRINVLHQGYDPARAKFVGPVSWSIVDYERAGAIARWLLATGKKGVAQPLVWSPELIAALLDSPDWRQRLRETSAVPPTQTPREAEHFTHYALLSAYPKQGGFKSVGGARKDPELEQKMKWLDRRLRRANPGCDTVHCSPLEQIVEKLGIKYDFPIGDTASLFGKVER